MYEVVMVKDVVTGLGKTEADPVFGYGVSRNSAKRRHVELEGGIVAC